MKHEICIFVGLLALLAGCGTASKPSPTPGPSLIGWHIAGPAFAQSITATGNGLDVCGWQDENIAFVTSQNDGSTWSAPVTVTSAHEGAICTVHAAPDNPQDVAVIVQACPTCYGGGSAAYSINRSEDGGASWTALTFPSDYFAQGPAVAWQQGTLYAVAAYNPFFKPTQIQPFPLVVVAPDQTAFTWVPAPQPLPTCACLHIVATAPRHLVVSFDTPQPSPLFSSTDGGQQWTGVQLKDAVGAPLFGLTALPDGRTLLANNGGDISTDAGQTWHTLPGLPKPGQPPDVLSTADAFASAPDGTLVTLGSTDASSLATAYALAPGATTWQSLGTVSPESLLAISTNGAGHIRALWGLLRSEPMDQNGMIIEHAQILQFTPNGTGS